MPYGRLSSPNPVSPGSSRYDPRSVIDPDRTTATIYRGHVRLATIRTDGATRAVRIDATSDAGTGAVELDAEDVGDVLRRDGWREWAAMADGPSSALGGLDFAPLITRPDKIVCVGLNYRTHIREMGHEFPEHPTLFAKYRAALIGANDDIVLPAASTSVDWEAELAVVIGTAVRHASVTDAEAAIAGYSVLNDVSVRDFQRRTSQFLQGKTFEASTPLGPWLVTPDEMPDLRREISCEVNGVEMQRANTSDLVFDPVAIVRYVSSIITLEPGDVIATGTPGGVGAARTPPVFLQSGDQVVTRIDGVGELRNTCRPE
ncbi:MAG: fumarylacetoacetate hydrolase family protein [Ilumatobacteraceae bacterium]